jgi:hypothetical protein
MISVSFFRHDTVAIHDLVHVCRPTSRFYRDHLPPPMMGLFSTIGTLNIDHTVLRLRFNCYGPCSAESPPPNDSLSTSNNNVRTIEPAPIGVRQQRHAYDSSLRFLQSIQTCQRIYTEFTHQPEHKTSPYNTPQTLRPFGTSPLEEGCREAGYNATRSEPTAAG